MKYRDLSKLLLLTLLLGAGFSYAADPEISDEPDFYSSPGLNSKRSYEVTDNLAIDTFSGTLQTHSADLVVPGIGPDIVVQRAYNSVLSVLSDYSYMGPGWDIHFGRIVGRYDCSGDQLTQLTSKLFFVKPDGSQIEILPDNLLFKDKNGNKIYEADVDYKPDYVTTDLWRVECRGNSLVITDTHNTDYYFGASDSPDVFAKQVVVKVEDSHGNTLNFNYELVNAFSRPTSIVASDGREVTFQYTNFQLTGVTDGDITIGYVYTGQHLSSVVFPEDLIWQYEYKDGSRLLSKVTTPLGAEIILAWDNYFFRNKDYPVVTSKCVEEQCWNYTYEREYSAEAGFVDKTIVETPYLTREEYLHVTPLSVANDEIWRIGLLTRKDIYHVSGNTVDVTPPNTCGVGDAVINTSTPISTVEYEWEIFTFSAKNRVYQNNGVLLVAQSYSRPLLKATVETKNGATYRYEVLSRVGSGAPEIVLEEGNATRYTRQTYASSGTDKGEWFTDLPAGHYISDHNGDFEFVSGMEYNELGIVTRKVEQGAETLLDYYADGTLRTVTDGVGNVTEYSDYYRGIPRRVEYPDLKSINRAVDDKGRITSETNQNQITTYFQYDDLDRITFIDMPVSLDVDVDYVISNNGGMTKRYTKGSLQEEYRYDVLGNMVQHERRDTASGQNFSTVINYNARNQVTFQSFVNESDKGTYYKYDRHGDLVVSYATTGEVTKRDSNGYSVKVTDSNCNETTHYFDAYSASDQQLKTISGPEGIQIEISRNTLGQPLTITQNSITREFRYNANWLLSYYKDPEADAEHRYSYDTAGRKVQETVGLDSDMYAIWYKYDQIGRLITQTYSDLYLADSYPWDLFVPASCGTPSSGLTCSHKRYSDKFSFTYDAVGNLEAKVKTTSVHSWNPYMGSTFYNDSTSWSYRYDYENRLESEELGYGSQYSPLAYRLSYRYDNYGYLTDMTYPGGYVVDYAPDRFGRPTRAGAVVSDIQYHDAGPVRSLTYGNGQVAAYTLNDRYLPETFKVTGGTTDLLSLQYAYDLNGNITGISDFVFPGKSQTMAYDGLDRLIQASGVWGAATYSYDPMSNITAKNVAGRNVGYQYDFARNRLTGFNGNSLGYDMFGRLVQEGEQRYLYDFKNNLIKAVNPGNQAVSYSYDASNRMQTRVSNTTDRFVYGVNGKLMYEELTDGDIKRSHIYVGSRLVGYHDIAVECSEDQDNDGITHCYERQNGLNPLYNDAADDGDSDGLSNFQEYQLGSKANAADSDEDGIADGIEIQYGFDLLVADSALDRDGDGFTNLEEIQQGSDPLVVTALGAANNFNASFATKTVVVTWTPVKFADGYDLYWSTSPFTDPSEATRIENVSSPFLHPASNGEQPRYYRLVTRKGSLRSAPSHQAQVELVSKNWKYVGSVSAYPDEIDVDNFGNAHILKHGDVSGIDVHFWNGAAQTLTGYDILSNAFSAKDLAVSRNGYALVLSANNSTRSVWTSIFDPATKAWTSEFLNKAQNGSYYFSDFKTVASDNGHFAVSWQEDQNSGNSRWVRVWSPEAGWSPVFKAGYLDSSSPYYSHSTIYYHAMDINNHGDMAITWLLRENGASNFAVHLLTRKASGEQSVHYVADVTSTADLVLDLADSGNGVLSWKSASTGDVNTQRFNMVDLINGPSRLGLTDPNVFALNMSDDNIVTAFTTESGVAKVLTQAIGQNWSNPVAGSFSSASYSPRKAVSVVDGGLDALNHSTGGDAIRYHQGVVSQILTTPAGFSPMHVSSASLAGDYARVGRSGAGDTTWPVYIYKSQTLTPNVAPQAIAGADIALTSELGCRLSAKLSSDSDGVIVSYAWKQISGPTVQLNDATYADASVYFLTPSSKATMEFEVTVTDDRGTQAKDSVIVTIDNPYGPPIANAGPDQQVVEGDTVQLNASASQAAESNPIVTYEWVQISGPEVLLSAKNSVTPTFQAPEVTTQTALQFKVTTYTDAAYYYTSTDTVTITVKDDEPPTANFGSDQTVNSGARVVLSYSARDPDGGSISMQFTVVSGSGVQLQNGSAANTLEFTAPTVSQDTVFTFRMTVSDDEGDTASDDVSVTVKAPVITALTSNAGPDQIVRSKVKVTLDGSGSKAPSGVSITKYAWARVSGPSVTLSSSSAIKPTFTAPTVTSAQTLVMRLTITGSNGKTASDTVSIAIKPGTNKVPVANAGADQTVNEGATVVLDGRSSSDPDGTSVSLSWSVVSGGALTLQQGSVAGIVQFVAPSVAADTIYTIQLKVTDVEGASSTDQVLVTVKNVPVVTPPAGACELDFDGNGIVEEVDFYGENYEGIFNAVYIYLNYNAYYSSYFPNTPVAKLDWNGDGTVTMEEVYTGTISVDTLHTFQTQHWFYLNDRNAYANYYPNSGCAL